MHQRHDKPRQLIERLRAVVAIPEAIVDGGDSIDRPGGVVEHAVGDVRRDTATCHDRRRGVPQIAK